MSEEQDKIYVVHIVHKLKKPYEQQQEDIKYQADIIDSQANRIIKQQDYIDALVKLVEAYRVFRNLPKIMDTYLPASDWKAIMSAEDEYDKTINAK